MFTLVKINNYPNNYTDKHILAKDKDVIIPLGCAIKLKDGKAVVADTADFPEYISTDTAVEGSCEAIAIPVNANMLFETHIHTAEELDVKIGTRVALFDDGRGPLAVTPSSAGCGRIVMKCDCDQKIYVQFIKK